jgi:2-methylisocitrate lyase-like PEP mutase family enzyme
MFTQATKYAQFHALHRPGQPLVLFNVWDPGSARAVAGSGAQALATGSWSVANAFGYDDGEQLPLPLAIANLQRITQVTDLPVTIDLESGYSSKASGVAQSITMAIGAGAVGCNIEDSEPVNGALYSITEHSARLAQARAAAQEAGVDFFINARSDVFFQAAPATHNLALVEQAMTRAEAYAKAGASGLFLPGLVDLELIAIAVQRSPLPINIMLRGTTLTRQQLADVGVARISHGPGPYVLVMQQLQEAAKRALQ